MNGVRNLMWFCLTFTIGLGIGLIGIVSYENNTFHPWEWKEAPVVVNCYGGDLDKLYIVEAMHYWVVKGHNFSYIEQSPTSTLCSAAYIQGFILIKQRDLPHNTLGVTNRRVFLGSIVAAVIYFDLGTYRITNVFEHELGHALGYSHVELDGHIMHPLWEKMSPKFWIPE